MKRHRRNSEAFASQCLRCLEYGVLLVVIYEELAVQTSYHTYSSEAFLLESSVGDSTNTINSFSSIDAKHQLLIFAIDAFRLTFKI